MENKLQILLEAGNEAIAFESFKASEIDGRIVTHCNQACHYIAEKMGLTAFAGLTANQIYSRMKDHADFAEVTPKDAQKLANDGQLVIAACQDKPHGHCAVIAPGTVLASGKWGHEAPQVFNCGRENRIISANWAFSDEPIYFAWIG